MATINEQVANEAALKQGLWRIDETSINRIMHHGRHGFIIISANRSEIYSDNQNNDLTPEYMAYCKKEGVEPTDVKNMNLWLKNRNKQAELQLKNDLNKSPFAYSPVYGGYHGTDAVVDSFEPSYIVYAHAKHHSNDYIQWDKLYNFALELTKKYKQDSVYVQSPNEAPIYVNGDGEKVNKTESKNFKFNDETQEFFTTTKREKRTKTDSNLSTPPQRFTADLRFEERCVYRKAGPSSYSDRMKRRQLGEVFLDED